MAWPLEQEYMGQGEGWQQVKYGPEHGVQGLRGQVRGGQAGQGGQEQVQGGPGRPGQEGQFVA